MSRIVAVLYTDAHRIEGVVNVRERLSDTLNDSLTDFLDLSEVRLSKLADPSHRQVTWPRTLIPKDSVIAATLDQERHESTNTRIDKVTRKSGAEVGVLVGPMEIYGTGHFAFQADPAIVLRHQLTSFFPITDATLIFPTHHDTRLQTQLALANRSKLRAFTLL